MKKQQLVLEPRVRLRLNQLLTSPERSGTQPSLAEPQQVVPLERLLQHRNKGIPVPVFNGVFSEQDTPDIQKLDFVEIALLKEQTTEGIQQSKEDLHALNKQYEQLLRDEAEKAVRLRKSSRNNVSRTKAITPLDLLLLDDTFLLNVIKQNSERRLLRKGAIRSKWKDREKAKRDSMNDL